MASLRLRRANHLRRQPRVEEGWMRRQISDPLAPRAPPPSPVHPLRKHNSYPQARGPQHVGSLLIRAVTVIERQLSTASSPGAALESVAEHSAALAPRASHTPAVRSGPPLSCNFCWNTIDECGRILRRKTQYHCPECRTNLCIVPCFHEYHEAEGELPSGGGGGGAVR